MPFKKIYFIVIVFFSLFFAGIVSASQTFGTINSSYYTAQVCEDATCTTTSTSPVNFGFFTNQSMYNVSITDNGLTGYMWGAKFGWVVLNCENTISGCSGTNGNFKVVPSQSGVLSGYAWGENSGWINFGPFNNSATNQVTINSAGEFNGYAWGENIGWIKFDCTLVGYCVKTDWVPPVNRQSALGAVILSSFMGSNNNVSVFTNESKPTSPNESLGVKLIQPSNPPEQFNLYKPLIKNTGTENNSSVEVFTNSTEPNKQNNNKIFSKANLFFKKSTNQYLSREYYILFILALLVILLINKSNKRPV